ncbi:MAG: hypothetical protein AAGL89_02785 [Pseudomonadota bacterium]
MKTLINKMSSALSGVALFAATGLMAALGFMTVGVLMLFAFLAVGIAMIAALVVGQTVHNEDDANVVA